ncbi:polysaccharide biosynthesis protein [Prochlorococcus marinus]|nr:nucleoside-diphosphate sugar epimerase/dehydratase [Prochlorococcus marinus]
MFIKDILLSSSLRVNTKYTTIAIYGAGGAGAQLVNSLILDSKYKIYALYDDNPSLWNTEIFGIRISPPSNLLYDKDFIGKLFIAMPSVDEYSYSKVIRKVEQYKIPIMQVPSINEITKGIANIDSLRPIPIEKLLGRKVVPPFTNLLENAISNLNICVTGAGGSIGTELCMQILRLNPKKLLLIDFSEVSLYNLINKINEDLSSRNINIEVIPLLGSTTNYMFLKNNFMKHKIDVVYHSAAYKHVPLLEYNVLNAIKNNIFSSLNVCKASLCANVKKVTLISSDKAVRPTNIMGSTKRISELIFQAYDSQLNNNSINQKKNTIFSIVRFGNVLESSGSVVPLFKEQISKGGPITLTHKDIIRYFMTIPEAAQLVIQASQISKGGEVFILDMGEPVKIMDLAIKMIRLSGLELKNADNLQGDIEIVITGLRPGEKLYEELLIGGDCYPTEHPLIYLANELSIPYEELMTKINDLKSAYNNMDRTNALNLMNELLPDWQRSKINS